MNLISPRVLRQRDLHCWTRRALPAAALAVLMISSTSAQDSFRRARKLASNVPIVEQPLGDPGDQATPLFSDLEPQFTDSLQTQKEQRFEALRRQIEDLGRALQGRPLQAPPISPAPAQEIRVVPLTPVSPQGNEVFAPPIPQDIPPPQSPSRDVPHDPPSHSPGQHAPQPDVQHGPAHGAPIHNAAQNPHGPGPASQPPRDQAPLVTGEVDRLALATSLYGAHDWDGCLHIIAETELTGRSREDQLWAEYLEACCRCKQGQLDESQAIYRRILAEPDAGWIGELARWWLEHLNERTRLKSDLDRLSTTMSNWEQVVESLTAKQP